MKNTDPNRQNLLNKIGKLALSAGKPVIEKALQLFYATQSPDTPAWAKRVIYGALAYLILPIDAIPDYLPVVVAGVKAVCDERLDMSAVQSTTHALTPLLIVSGPIAPALVARLPRWVCTQPPCPRWR